MRKIVSLITILLSFQLSAQTFVKDVETVKVITIAYCVDDKGEIYDAKIDTAKTSYEHEGWQAGALEHFKKGKLPYPMKMVNKCWKHVYYFVNEEYKTKTLEKSRWEECKKFHTGTFSYVNPAYSNTQIKRRDRRQIEKSSEQRQIYGIEWTEDHKYTLRTIFLPLKKDKHKIGGLIDVEIIEIFGDTYLYKSKLRGKNGRDIYGLIKKIK